MAFLHQVPLLYRAWLPAKVIFKGPNENVIYLTFDDGPTEKITPWILAILKSYSATATFFLVGKNAENLPDLVSRIVAEGHTVGNHTHRHINGWKTRAGEYVSDAARAAPYTSNSLFRPPYGRLTRRQARALIVAGYQIVMWSLLTGDWRKRIEPEKILLKIKGGDIVVLHDNAKAEENLKILLPRILSMAKAKGYRVQALLPTPST